MAPVLLALTSRPQHFEAVFCATGQHAELLEHALEPFGLTPDIDLQLMRAGQTPSQVAARVLEGMDRVLSDTAPDVVLVHGDTTTTLGAALAAFHARIPVGHVEAGLRSGDLDNPFPEEGNRIIADRLSRYCYAPTEGARQNLLRELIPDQRILVTGNTAIDALLHVAGRLEAQGGLDWREISTALAEVMGDASRRLVLVTAHRRESFGAGLRNICAALRQLADAHADWVLVYPVHPNPAVRSAADQQLGGCANVLLIDPLEYQRFVALMRRADLVLTDSGGLQEEAPSLDKPVVVMRARTERPEVLDAGAAVLAGVETDGIVAQVERILGDEAVYRAMAGAANPYGDGRAAERIVEHLARAEC